MTSSFRGVSQGGGVPGTGRRIPPAGRAWVGAAWTALAAVGWAFAAMASVAALGLHLLGADAQGALGPMTAAAMVLAVGGTVSPSGDVSVFGIHGAGATAAIDIMPLGVSLAGALPLAWVFLRGLGRAATVAGTELAARAAMVAGLFTAAVAGLAWAGHSTVTLDGALLGRSAAQGQGLPGALAGLGDLGSLGSLGGGLAGALGELVKDRTSVGFQVVTGPSVAGGLLWVLAVLALALLCSRYSPLPPAWSVLHRWARPAASALGRVLLLAVAAGMATALYGAIGDAHPGRVVGAALLGSPNGVWAAISIGLFVPWRGTASGPLAALVPHPVGTLLAGGGHAITVTGLAGADGRVWLLPAAAGLAMLAAGVLTAAYTPADPAAGPGRAAVGCAVRLSVAGAAAVPLVGRLAGVSVSADLSVFGVDAVGSAIALVGGVLPAVALGALWGAAAGALGALLARAAGAAGRRAAPAAVSAQAAAAAALPDAP